MNFSRLGRPATTLTRLGSTRLQNTTHRGPASTRHFGIRHQVYGEGTNWAEIVIGVVGITLPLLEALETYEYQDGLSRGVIEWIRKSTEISIVDDEDDYPHAVECFSVLLTEWLKIPCLPLSPEIIEATRMAPEVLKALELWNRDSESAKAAHAIILASFENLGVFYLRIRAVIDSETKKDPDELLALYLHHGHQIPLDAWRALLNEVYRPYLTEKARWG